MAAIAATFAVSVLVTVTAPAGADTADEIRATKAKIERLAASIESKAAEVNRLQSEADALTAEINSVLAEISRTEREIRQTQDDIRRATAAMRRLQALIDERAKDAYERGGASTLEVLLDATSLHDLASRLEFVDQAAATDRDLFDAVANQRSELRRKQLQLRDAQEELRAQRIRLDAQQNQLQAKLDAAGSALTSLQADQEEAEGLLQTLEIRKKREERAARIAAQRAAAEAAALLQAARSAAPPSGGGGGGGGAGSGDGPFYVCPVDPPRAYSNDFGAPRSGGRTHQGNDIFAPYGTPVRAPFAGTAVDASNSLGGISVNVYGSQGYVYNAHLSSIARLGPVSTGTVIGYVGNSGNARGTSPHNHFEWHPGGGGAVNPYYYLNEVC